MTRLFLISGFGALAGLALVCSGCTPMAGSGSSGGNDCKKYAGNVCEVCGTRSAACEGANAALDENTDCDKDTAKVAAQELESVDDAALDVFCNGSGGPSGDCITQASPCSPGVSCCAGLVCGADGYCEFPQCHDDIECGPGQICDPATFTCVVRGCREDADCGYGQVCDPSIYQCVQQDGGGDCTSDADCEAQEMCISGNCTAVECKTSADCATGRHCDDVHKCVDGSPIGSPCTSSYECGETGVCVYSACAATCSSDADCLPPLTCSQIEFGKRVCQEGQVGCLADSDCLEGEICDIASGECVNSRCWSDADCAGSPSTPKCEVNNGACVQCIVSADCPPNAPACDSYSHSCVGTAGCVSDANCWDPAKPKCDVNTGVCVASSIVEGSCTTSADCAPPTPICDAFGSGVCVACTGDLDCQAGYRCDATTKSCFNGGGSDGGSGDGGVPPTGECAQCTSDADCSPGLTCYQDLISQLMGTPGACQMPCTSDADCAQSSGTKTCASGSGGLPIPVLGPTPLTPGAQCSSDADCSPGETCQGGMPPLLPGTCGTGGADGGTLDGGTSDSGTDGGTGGSSCACSASSDGGLPFP